MEFEIKNARIVSKIFKSNKNDNRIKINGVYVLINKYFTAKDLIELAKSL